MVLTECTTDAIVLQYVGHQYEWEGNEEGTSQGSIRVCRKYSSGKRMPAEDYCRCFYISESVTLQGR